MKLNKAHMRILCVVGDAPIWLAQALWGRLHGAITGQTYGRVGVLVLRDAYTGGSSWPETTIPARSTRSRRKGSRSSAITPPAGASGNNA